MKNYRAELTGVFGDPVDDNPTGVVEEAAFAAKKLNYRYLTVKVRPEDLQKAMDSVSAQLPGVRPHKETIKGKRNRGRIQNDKENYNR